MVPKLIIKKPFFCVSVSKWKLVIESLSISTSWNKELRQGWERDEPETKEELAYNIVVEHGEHGHNWCNMSSFEIVITIYVSFPLFLFWFKWQKNEGNINRLFEYKIGVTNCGYNSKSLLTSWTKEITNLVTNVAI